MYCPYNLGQFSPSRGVFLFAVILFTQGLANHAVCVVVNILAEHLGVFFELLRISENQVDRVVVSCPLTANAVVVVPAVKRAYDVFGDIF